jgi:hypothetical protein
MTDDTARHSAHPHGEYDHDGTARHHHHDLTGEPVWWLNADTFGGAKYQHRHPTDAEMDALEAIVHPEGRCTVCGGGKPYWKHTANETEYHPFTQSVRSKESRDERARHAALVKAARAFIDWYDQPYIRDGGPAVITDLRAVLEGEPLSPPKPKRKRRPTYIDAEGNRRTDYSEEPR